MKNTGTDPTAAPLLVNIGTEAVAVIVLTASAILYAKCGPENSGRETRCGRAEMVGRGRTRVAVSLVTVQQLVHVRRGIGRLVPVLDLPFLFFGEFTPPRVGAPVRDDPTDEAVTALSV